MLLLQIAALQIYIDYAQKGYAVVKKGLNFIGDVKKGEVNLHSDYFSSLGKVNPKIKNYAKVAEIISMQIQIIKTYKSTFERLRNDDLFHGDELDYIQRAFDRLLDNCNATLNELIEVTTDVNLEMKDDQRIERIDGLHRTMMDDYAFCQSFCKQASLLSLSKTKENDDVKWSSALQGL
ncbi:MAG TPA: hypothetical protein VFS71_07025 [Flavobacterium sp.]|uniref:hypothetical protein n=1 Tax=Flavobacterium sp. TaxID=239 RepID=UPI002DBD4ECF|nr:hypothetical protein [Flavobacterium sp.]HEU4789419.1 hypothetical protein [Flavobacterium sp.]